MHGISYPLRQPQSARDRLALFRGKGMSVVQNDGSKETPLHVETVFDPQLVESVNNTIHHGIGVTREEADTTSLEERVKMLELVVNFVSQQNFPQDADQTYGMLIAKAMRGKESKTLKPLCPTCGKTFAFGGVCRDYFHQPMPVRDIIG